MKNNGAKILLLDIETSPNLAWIWGNYEQNAIKHEESWEILSCAFKWLGDKQVHVVTREGSRSDKGVMKVIHDYMDKADIVVAHNGSRFDVKKINTRFAFYDMSPPSPYKLVDTLSVAHRHFAFNSNRLNDLGTFLGLGEKVKTGGFDLWMDCIKGDAKAWKVMEEYNKQDVILLEKVYDKLLPWMNTHPNIGMWEDGLICPKCGSKKLQARGFAINATTKYRRFQCQACGGWGRVTKSERIDKPIVNA